MSHLSKINRIRLSQVLYLCFLLAGTTSWAQTSKLASYVYRIEARSQNGSETEAPSLLTGFKVAGYPGIVTALHGLVVKMGTGQHPDIMAFSYKYGSTVNDKTYTNLRIEKIDIGKDLAFLQVDGLLAAGGLTLLSSYTPHEYEPVYVYGYPESQALDGRNGSIQSPPNPTLSDLVMGEYKFRSGKNLISLRDYFSQRGSPALDGKVYKLSPGLVDKGMSGGPVLNERNQVIGAANGGYYNSENIRMSTWAISAIQVKKMNEYERGKALRNLLQFTNGNVLKSAEGSSTNQPKIVPQKLARNYQKAFGFRKETPRFLIGGVVSRPLEPALNGVTLNTDWTNLNAFLDIYADAKLVDRVMLGGYLTSSYLQYKLVRRLGNGLPLEPEGINSSAKHYFDRFGAQLTLLPIRGVLHHVYVGAGGFYKGLDDPLTNYRFFLGYRQYLFHRKYVALDFRLIRATQYERELTASSLGNAHQTVQPLTSYYLCAGINFALFRRF